MSPKVKIVNLNNIEEMIYAFPLVKQLTPALTEPLYRKYLNEMIPHHYYQIAALAGDHMIGVSGYWLATKLYCGKYLEVDNFIVDVNYRSQHIGAQLLQALEHIATSEHCDVMMLDAYLQNEKAHRFYERYDFRPKGYHFIKKIRDQETGNECIE